MGRPNLADVRTLAGRRVRLVVPKPRENQRLVGTVVVDDDGVGLRIEEGGADRFGTVRLRERERDGVLQAYLSDGTLVGRVTRLSTLEAE
ncbi:hypothetical protein [Natronomonas marina]|jgi:hypothetical protein|uniref:hypothetical protein n=1 Tax=Natronomonas marina TaxID=2961939 RepID=UPI0020C9A6DA|nr:hypothetical protein [Natronomonas marina]